MTDWRPEHSKTIYAFLDYLNQNSNDFILKGGTALLTCYKLDRFSEDIDLDGKNKGIEEIVKGFCDMYGFAYRIAKDTDTVKRYMVNYGNTGKPLKVEVSFRRKEIGTDGYEYHAGRYHLLSETDFAGIFGCTLWESFRNLCHDSLYGNLWIVLLAGSENCRYRSVGV